MMRLASSSLVAGPLAGCEAAAAPAKLVADLHGSLLYKREPMRVYLGRAVRAARDGSGAR
jgi:hypothetical protein